MQGAMPRVVSLARKLLRSRAVNAHRARPHTTIVVAAGPDEALLASAGALRRLGARIVRYDSEGSALEARWAAAPATVCLRAITGDTDTTCLSVETDAARPRTLFRRFRAELARRNPG